MLNAHATLPSIREFHVVSEACMDLVIGLTACSAGQSNKFTYEPIQYEVLDAR